jgi:CTP:molybdopterin cytidylyltransferase MocA
MNTTASAFLPTAATQPNAGLLLAAGAGRRYGGPKAFAVAPSVPGHDEELLVERAARTLCEGGCAPVVVVLGTQAERAEPLRLQQRFGAQIVINTSWASGMGSSLQVGLAALPTQAPAVVVLLVDTPGITADAVRRVGAQASPDTLRIATYADGPGHPVLLGRAHWAGAAASAVGDAGARHYLAGHHVEAVPCDDIADGTDLDVPHA